MPCRWTLTSTLLFTHLQFMSSHYHQPPSCCWPFLPCREGEMDLKEEQKEEEKSLWANAHLLPDLHMEFINKIQSLTGFWHHWRTCFELISEELVVTAKHRAMMQLTVLLSLCWYTSVWSYGKGRLGLIYFCHIQYCLFDTAIHIPYLNVFLQPYSFFDFKSWLIDLLATWGSTTCYRPRWIHYHLLYTVGIVAKSFPHPTDRE